jgi:hypothetical protein
MTDPKPGFRDPSYQHRAYLAEAVVQHRLTVEGKLLGWDSHEDVVEFHQNFAKWPNPCEIRKGSGRGGSAYYEPYQRLHEDGTLHQDGHYVRLLARERQVLAYTHEVAHSILDGRAGQGHTPRWAGTYIVLLRLIDADAAVLLQAAFREARLTIDMQPHILELLRDVPGMARPRRRRAAKR